jgi:hypothetical protein
LVPEAEDEHWRENVRRFWLSVKNSESGNLCRTTSTPALRQVMFQK